MKFFGSAHDAGRWVSYWWSTSARLASINFFHLVAVGLFLFIIQNGQGNDAARAVLASGGLNDAFTHLLLPAAAFGFLLYLSSVSAALASAQGLSETSPLAGRTYRSTRRLTLVIVPTALAAIPPVAVSLIATGWSLLSLGSWTLLLVLTLYLVARTVSRAVTDAGRRARFTGFLLAVSSCALISLCAVAAVNVNASRNLGPIGVALIALGLWTIVLTLVFVTVPTWLRIPKALFGLIVLVVVGLSASGEDIFPHRPWRIDGSPSLPSPKYVPFDMETGFFRWLEERVSPESTGPIPVLLVASEGGGIRAAYWSARTLAEFNFLSDGRVGRYVYAYSGVSGGSLGLATFLDSASLQGHSPSEVIKNVEDFYKADFLSPALGRVMIAEPVRQLLPNIGIQPRDEAFETLMADEWTRAAHSDAFARPLLELTGSTSMLTGSKPAVFFASTNVESGQRIVLSNVAMPHSVDWFLLADRGEFWAPTLTLAEAVHLGARFPFISPPAALYGAYWKTRYERVMDPGFPGGYRDEVPVGCTQSFLAVNNELCGNWEQRRWGALVDGGYFDNSGTGPIRDVLERLTCLRDNDNCAASSLSEGDSRLGVDDLARRRALLARVSFHIVVFRNDPEIELNMHYMHEENPVSEFGAIVKTVLRAREARAQVAREEATRAVRATKRLRDECDIPGPPTTAGEKWRDTATAAKCPRLNDSYHEVSLWSGYSFAKQSRNDAAMLADFGCEGTAAFVDPPLGWMLSSTARREMACASKVFLRPKFLPLDDYWDALRGDRPATPKANTSLR